MPRRKALKPKEALEEMSIPKGEPVALAALPSDLIIPLPDGRLLAFKSTAGPASYSSGGFTVSFTALKKVESVVAAFSNGGYLAEPTSISDNTVTVVVKYFNYPATAAGAAVEVPAATDLSGVTFYICAVGH